MISVHTVCDGEDNIVIAIVVLLTKVHEEFDLCLSLHEERFLAFNNLDDNLLCL